MHGFWDNGWREGHLGEEFSAFGFDFFTLDMRGHGKSDGRPGELTSVEEGARDIAEYLQLITNLYQ